MNSKNTIQTQTPDAALSEIRNEISAKRFVAGVLKLKAHEGAQDSGVTFSKNDSFTAISVEVGRFNPKKKSVHDLYEPISEHSQTLKKVLAKLEELKAIEPRVKLDLEDDGRIYLNISFKVKKPAPISKEPIVIFIDWFDQLKGIGEGLTKDGTIVFLNSEIALTATNYFDLKIGSPLTVEVSQNKSGGLYVSKIISTTQTKAS